MEIEQTLAKAAILCRSRGRDDDPIFPALLDVCYGNILPFLIPTRDGCLRKYLFRSIAPGWDTLCRERIGVFGGAALVAFLTLTAAGWADTISYADAVTVLAKDCGSRHQEVLQWREPWTAAGSRPASKRTYQRFPQSALRRLASVLTSIAQRQEAQASVFKVCQHDVSQYCNSVKGDGNILSCLVETKRVDSKACNQAITDAGWR